MSFPNSKQSESDTTSDVNRNPLPPVISRLQAMICGRRTLNRTSAIPIICDGVFKRYESLARQCTNAIANLLLNCDWICLDDQWNNGALALEEVSNRLWSSVNQLIITAQLHFVIYRIVSYSISSLNNANTDPSHLYSFTVAIKFLFIADLRAFRNSGRMERNIQIQSSHVSVFPEDSILHSSSLAPRNHTRTSPL